METIIILKYLLFVPSRGRLESEIQLKPPKSHTHSGGTVLKVASPTIVVFFTIHIHTHIYFKISHLVSMNKRNSRCKTNTRVV